MHSVKLFTYFLLIISFSVDASIDKNTPTELTLEIILKLEEAEHNFPHKDEFETTIEYTERANAYIKNVLNPLTRPTYKISKVLIEKSYDADNSMWTFSLFSLGLETEKILITFFANELRKNDTTEHIVSVDIKLANSFPVKHLLPMKRDLAKAINESIRARFSFNFAATPYGNKKVSLKRHFPFIQTSEYKTLFIDLAELQLYSMDTILAIYSKDNERIYQIDNKLASQMQARLTKQKEHISKEIKKYTELITETVYSNLITDKNTMKDKRCTLTISLAPSGVVNNVFASKGDTEVCNATKKSILNIGTLPVSQEPHIFKEIAIIHLTIAPEF